MIHRTSLRRASLFAAALLAAGASQAAITIYTDKASFLSAVTGAQTIVGFDDFNDFATVAGPVDRSADGIDYSVSSSPNGTLVRTGTAADGSITAGAPRSTLMFSGFESGVFAAGATFYGVVSSGADATGGRVTISATDSTGASVSQINRVRRTDNFFVGFVSTGELQFVDLRFTGGSRAIATADDLVLAQAVPEPGSLAMLASGLAAIGLMVRRRRA